MTPSEIINYEDWDVLSFGIKRDEEMELPIDKLNVKYHADMENTRSDMEKYFKGETLDNLPPIEVSYEKGKYYIEDGHHRYAYAKQLGKSKVKVIVTEIKDNPITALGFDSIDDVINIARGNDE